MKRLLFLIVLLLGIQLADGQQKEEKWEFSNSTPYQTVKSHLYFLEKGEHFNPLLASYTLADVNIPQKRKEALTIQLRDILLALHIKPEEIPNRRRGIVEHDKYQIFPSVPEIYLIRENRKWSYSPATIKQIPKLYKKYVLRLKPGMNAPNKQIEDAIISKKLNQDSGRVALDMSTPFNTISSHLIFLSDSLFDPEKAAKTINFAPEDTSDAPDLAIKLKQIFQGAKKQVFSFEDIPKDSNYVDTGTGEHIYYPNPDIPQLYLEKIDGKWYYSRATSKLIRSVHEEMYGNEADVVFHFSDKFKRWAGVNNNKEIIFNIRLWQVLMLLYFIGIFLLLILLNRLVIRNILHKVHIYEPYKHIFYHVIRAIIYITFFNSLKVYAPSMELSVEYNFIFLHIINLLIIFYYTILAWVIVDFLKEYLTRDHDQDSRFGLVLFASMILKALIIITSLLFFVREMNYNVVNFLAGLSIGGFALAFGAQDTIKNFLGSLMIFADKSFGVGDWIQNESVSGTVEEIGLRSTKIRTFYNSVVTVPNSLLSDKSIDNMGKRKYRRYKSKIVLKYGTPPDKINEFIDRIKQLIDEHPDTRKDYYMVYINEFGTYGIEVLIYLFFKVPTWNLELKARHEIISSVLKVQEEMGIELSIPLVSKSV